MRAVVTRIKKGQVEVGGKTVGRAGKGLLVTVAFKRDDTEEKIRWMADRVAHLRIFRGENGKLNRHAAEENGEALVVSNFTLYGDALHGRRPDFSLSAPFDIGLEKYEMFVEELKKYLPVETGVFGGDMTVSVEMWGPANVIIDN